METQVVGKSIPRINGTAVVSGRAKYGIDVAIEGMLWGKVLRSPLPHAEIRRIDVSGATRLPGVFAVLTAKDVTGKRHGFALKDETILAVGKVRCIGDAVALVAAINEEVAEEALGLISVDYEELPAVFEPEEAMRLGAPLVHENLETYEPARPGAGMWNPVRGTNIVHQVEFEKGDVRKGFSDSDLIFEDRFETSQVQHCHLDPHAALANVEPGFITVWSSTQKVFLVRSALAEIFGVPESKVRVIATRVGGAFGGKSTCRLEPYVVVLAMATGKPVKMIMSRTEEFTGNAGSAPATIQIKTGVKRDGRILAREMKFLWNSGAYAEAIPPSNRALKDGVGAYDVPNLKVSSTLVYTNRLRGTPFRGLGNPETTWAVESQTDIIAAQLGMDPLEFRMLNALDEEDESPMGDVIRSVGLKECLRRVAQKIGWQERKRRENHGYGIVLVHKSPTAFGTVSGAIAMINEDGSAQILIGSSEIGCGSDTILCQIAAEELGIPVENVSITSADTGVTPFDEGSFSSRVTLYAGNAVANACRDVKKRLLELAASLLETAEGDLAVGGGCVFLKQKPETRLIFSELAHASHKKGGLPMGNGWAKGGGIWLNEEGKRSIPGWKFGAQAVEIEMDPETGSLKILRMVSAHDVGKAINPMAVEGQIEGGALMGMGYALFEEMAFDHGQVTNPSLAHYKIPTISDMPALSSIIVEQPLPEGPFGAKGVGELSLLGVAPAIANAIFDAAGVRIRELPIGAEKLWRAVKNKNER